MAVADLDVVKIDRAGRLRTLKSLENQAAKLRSELGLVQREAYATVAPEEIKPDGVSRLRTDQIDRLHETGKINQDQRAAALKFRTVWEAMSRGLYPGGHSEIVGTKSRGSYRHPLERMTEKELAIWFLEYRPWANGPAAKTAIDKGGFKKSYLQICYAIIIDNYGPAQIERMWPISRGNNVIVPLFRTALNFWKHVDVYDAVELMKSRDEMMTEAASRLVDLRPTRRTS